jgi:hypothetical protein
MESSGVAAPYRALKAYLDSRFANTVVLRFAEIEDILGFQLPHLARLQQDWWANPTVETTASEQSESWTHGKRTATPNLVAQTVTFARGSA